MMSVIPSHTESTPKAAAGTASAALRHCAHCGHQTEEKVRACPACGKPVFTKRQVRVLGVLLFAIGALIFGAMAAAMVSQTPTYLNPGVLIDGSRFTGSAEQGAMAIGLFGWGGFIGAAFAAIGAHQWRTGLRNKWLLRVAAVLIVMTVMVVLNFIRGFD